MGAVDVTLTRKEALPILGQKMVVITTSTTGLVGGTDVATLTLANFGMTKILGVLEFVHTTDYSVIAQGTPTTAVSAGVLTVTTSAGNNDKRRVIVVYGE